MSDASGAVRPGWVLLTVTLLLGTVLAVPASASARLKPAAAGTRAMWLWDAGEVRPADVLAWARARGVKEVFVHADARLPSDAARLARLRELKRGADTARIRLTALGGDPRWALDHAAARAWQRAVLGTGLFAGSHVDVEPYVLPGWRTDQPALVAGLLRMLQLLQADDPRPLEADVPFWYGTVPAGPRTTLADAVLARVDAVTVMSYRDTVSGPNSLTAVGADMLARAGRAGRPARLAAETAPLTDCRHCTFHEEGAARMTAALAKVDAVARAYPAFAGIAVHHYTAWRAMRR
ncbi:hypothetical protein [Planomonospora parontospora]|uniref:hypothetical protein n=1 Tax=Planomonospora parontospora TaxID=58119 RepID=UPI00166F9EB7|nr:hypothetical protein [Planomonospora parontospora]GGL11382.1 hypothetical protein GCM10014719_11570 [Planomonospora parontospora subsp. antibiotica]GII14871.1 hypothetical protein Ppa05_15970 [Planomonospora parontospora subsp. antibiotica]